MQERKCGCCIDKDGIVVKYSVKRHWRNYHRTDPKYKNLHFYGGDNFGSLDGLCPRLYDRPDVSLFQYTWR
jgi:hypothetical protein